MLHENEKFYFIKSFKQLKLTTSPDKYFPFLWNNVYEFLGINYCTPKRCPKGPLQLSLPPLAQTSSYATDCPMSGVFHYIKVFTEKKLVVLATYLPFLIGFGNGTGTSYYCTFLLLYINHDLTKLP